MVEIAMLEQSYQGQSRTYIDLADARNSVVVPLSVSRRLTVPSGQSPGRKFGELILPRELSRRLCVHVDHGDG